MFHVYLLTISVAVFGTALVDSRLPYPVIDVPTHTQMYGTAKITCYVFNAQEEDVARVFRFYRTHDNDSREELGQVTVSEGKPEGEAHEEPIIAGRSSMEIKSSNLAVLEIKNVTCADEGEYGCEMGSVQASALFMDVVASPETPELTWEPVEIYAEEFVTFTCTADVGRPAGNLAIFLDNGTRSDMNTTTKVTLSENGCTSLGTASVKLMLPSNASDTRVGCEVIDQEGLYMSLEPAVTYTPDLEVHPARTWYAKEENFWTVVGIGIGIIVILILLIIAICTMLRRRGYKTVE